MKSAALRVWRVLAVRKAGEACLGGGFCLLLLTQQVLFFLFQRDAVLALERNGMLVMFHPAEYGLAAGLVLLVLYLGVYSAANPARERESGALETLFYGPVSAGRYLLAELTAVMSAAAASMLFLLVALIVGSLSLGYDLPAGLAGLFGLGLLCILAVTSMGFFMAIFFKQARAAAMILLALALVSLSTFAGDLILSRFDVTGSFFLVYLRTSLAAVNAVFRFVFPLGLLLDDLVRFESFGGMPWQHLAWYPFYAGVFFLAALETLRRRGVIVR